MSFTEREKSESPEEGKKAAEKSVEKRKEKSTEVALVVPLRPLPNTKKSVARTVLELALGVLESVLTAENLKREVAPGVPALERHEFEAIDWRLRAIFEHGYRS